jgi:hypothetical protein
MDEERKKIITKVVKLFKLAKKAGSEMEAAAAAFRAEEILRKYNLSMSDVNDFAADAAECGESQVRVGRTIPHWKKMLSEAVCELYACRCLLRTEKIKKPGGTVKQTMHIIFVGVRPDDVIAARSFDFLSSWCRRRAKTHGFTGKKAVNYYFYFAFELMTRVGERRQKHASSETALVPLRSAAAAAHISLTRGASLKKARRRTFTIPPIPEESLFGSMDARVVRIDDPLPI